MIYLINHAQSTRDAGDFNTSDRNIPLTDVGCHQSKQLNFSFNILIISPLKRCLETYTNSNVKVGSVIVSELFREHVTTPNNLFEYEDFVYEMDEDFEQRVKESIEFLKKLDTPNINIGIITHNDYIEKFTQITQGSGLTLPNCAHHFIQRLP